MAVCRTYRGRSTLISIIPISMRPFHLVSHSRSHLLSGQPRLIGFKQRLCGENKIFFVFIWLLQLGYWKPTDCSDWSAGCLYTVRGIITFCVDVEGRDIEVVGAAVHGFLFFSFSFFGCHFIKLFLSLFCLFICSFVRSFLYFLFLSYSFTQHQHTHTHTQSRSLWVMLFIRWSCLNDWKWWLCSALLIS